MSGVGAGDRGGNVVEIQQHLDYLGYNVGQIDGIFGAKTKSAVLLFQRDHLVTGRVDASSRAKLTQAVMTEKERRKTMVVVPSGLAGVKQTFGEIEYEEAEGGYVKITNGWEANHIVTVRLPIVGRCAVHKRLAGVFEAVLTELEQAGLADEIQQWGVWCPRHKMHNPSRNLSAHSWAIACDINWAENPVGRVGEMDPRIVAVFEAHGFNWGGRWRTRDDMHFQYCRNY